MTLILETRPAKQEVLGKTLDTIEQAAIRVARRTPDSVRFQEIFVECTSAHNDLHRHRGVVVPAGKNTVRPSRCVKILILLNALLKLWTKPQSSVSVRKKSRTRRSLRRSCHIKNIEKFIKPFVGGIAASEWCWLVCCFRVREKEVQHHRHRSHEFPKPCQTFPTQHVP